MMTNKGANVQQISDDFDRCVRSFADLFGDCSKEDAESILVCTFDFMIEKIAASSNMDSTEIHAEILDALDNN